MTEVVIYTDGACSGNPGPGGWGAVLRWQDTEKELYGGDPQTTNNRMELMAAIQALETLQRPATVDLYTDSKYLLDGITKWIKGWQRNGWLTSAKKPVKNDDLWRRLIEANVPHEVSGAGCAAMTAILRTSASMRWRDAASRRPPPWPVRPGNPQ